MKAIALFTIACVLGANACNPCERRSFLRACGLGQGEVDCEDVTTCTFPEHCLPCGVCASDDECGTLAGTCSEEEPCRIGQSCNESCGCVVGE